MSQQSGFFDAVETSDGVFDREYLSADYCDNLATVIKNGVRYSNDNDLEVTAAGTMALNVAPGRAWIDGHYYYNDTPYTGLTISTAPVGNFKRIDRVVLRLDTSIAVRSIYLAIVEGTAASEPIAPPLTRTGTIYELCLANITVPAGATAITAEMITDTRGNNGVCGWAASVSPAIMSLLKQYTYNTTLTGTVNTVAFDIPQYRPDEPCILDVYTNGVLEIRGTDYTVSGTSIIFTQNKVAGTEITVVVQKSIDGEGLASVADEITQIQNTIATLQSDNEYVYNCNGATDNVEISALAQAFLNGGTDYATMKIRVVGGNIGVTNAASGDGSALRHYKWFNIGQTASTNRRVIIDFSNAGQISIPITAGTYNDIFCGNDCYIIGANVSANQTGANTQILMFADSTGAIRAENCRFWINASLNSYIANNGTFVNCRGSVSVTGENAYCFAPSAATLIRIDGGEYYAYCGGQTLISAVLYCTTAGACGIAYGVNCPSVSRSGFYQKYAIYATGGAVSITDTITTLTVNAPAANIRGTLAVNKTGLM